MGVAAAIAALSMRLKVGIAASVAASVLARPEFVTIYKIQKRCHINAIQFSITKSNSLKATIVGYIVR